MPSSRKSGPGRRNDRPSGPAKVYLLDHPQWQRAGMKTAPLSDKDAALLAVLALDGPQPRAALCELLWPASTASQRFANLRSRASRLARASGTPFIEVRDTVRLHDELEIDLRGLDDFETGDLLAYRLLLAGVDLGDHGELDDWIQGARRRVDERVAKRLAQRADALEERGRPPADALEIARRVVELMPLAESESAWHRLIQLHYVNGNGAAARDAFTRYASALDDECGVRPGPALSALMQAIESSERPVAARHHPIPPGVLRPPRLVGRESPWQAMWAAWQQRQAFVVVGAAGLGKTRIVEEFCRDLEGVVGDAAGPEDAQGPLTLVGRLLLDIDRRFTPSLGAECRTELARFHPRLGRRNDAPARNSLIEHAIVDMLAAAMARGLRAIVVDDLHNADASSVAMLRRLASRPALRDLRLGFATRPTETEALWTLLRDWALDSSRLVRIDLLPLSRPELDELLASLMLPGRIDRGFAERLFQHAGGQPLFTLATLEAVLLNGEDLATARLPLPTSVQALLDARISTLPATTVDLLRVAAIAGPDLSAERAARMLGCPVLALAPAWAELERADVLRGEGFSHGLVHEAALRYLPDGLRPALHRQFAASLEGDAAIHPARVAWHWEQGGTAIEAGRCWHAAADAAGRVGLIQERNQFLSSAARCHEVAGDASSRFDALASRLEGMQLRPGGAAVLLALPEVEALADTDERRLRCRLARVEALLGLERTQEALAEARRPVREADGRDALRSHSDALLAQALVQCGHSEEALIAADRAVREALSSSDRPHILRARQALGFVHFYVADVPSALAQQREAVKLAHAIGDRFEEAASEGHVAALLAVLGDVRGAYEQALVARRRQGEVGLDADGVMGSVNERVLGASAAALGRFDEGIDALRAAIAAAGEHAAPAASAKARLDLASVWLRLGRIDLARPLLDGLRDESDTDPSRQVLLQLLMAQAAEAECLPVQRYLGAIARIDAAHAGLPLVQSFSFESSFQGPAPAAIERLRSVRREFERLGFTGTARSLQWRELARWLDVPGADASASALALACALEPFVDGGLSAKCHPPAVWESLAQAFGRVGDERRRAHSIDRARNWLENALRHVPMDCRDAFRQANPLHRRLLGGGASSNSKGRP